MAKNRTPFIDHLRIFLTALVIFHHAAITYGAIGGWYWRAVLESTDLPLSAKILSLFCAINQSYFMGFFFLLAGYFVPSAFDRKGAKQFLIDRLVRLGIPLLFHTLVLSQVTVALAAIPDGDAFLPTLLHLWKKGWISPGPLWFAETLLIFSAAYVLWRKIIKPEERLVPTFPTQRALVLAAIGVGIGAFLIRLIMPTGKDFLGLQIGFFASYIVLFVVGCLAWEKKWLEHVEIVPIRPWLILSFFMTPVLPVALSLGGSDEFSGGWSFKAVLYAFWEPLMGWGMILGLLYFFRTRWNNVLPATQWLSERAYTVYIVHPPVLVGICLVLQPLAIPVLLKFLLAGSLAWMGCHIVATILLLILGTRKVL